MPKRGARVDFEAALDAARPSTAPVGAHFTYLSDPDVLRFLHMAWRRKQKDRNWTWPALIEVVNRCLREMGKPQVTSSGTTVAAFCRRRFSHAE